MRSARCALSCGVHAVILALSAALVPTAAAAAGPLTAVFALGGPATLPDEALARAHAELEVVPARLAGADRFATAAAISRHAHPDGVGNLFVVTAAHHADATAAATAVVARRGALLPVERDRVPDVIAAEAVRLDPRRVYVVGGPGAVSDGVARRLGEITGAPVTRVAGIDRYGTAVAASRLGRLSGAAAVYLASGHSAADALVAAQAVAAHEGALLLTEPGTLPDAVAEELRRLAPQRLYVLGGPGAIADSVLAQAQAVTGIAPERLAGPDRVETARAVSRHAHPEGVATVYLASARAAHDALTATGAVAASAAGLLLIEPHVPRRWTPRLDQAIRHTATRSGSVSFAVIGTDGVLVGHRADARVPAASVLKVMFMAAYLRQPSVAGRALTDSDRALLEPMIRRSANEPATRIANMLGPDPLYRLAAESGMRDFSYTRPWGLSGTSARDQARFLLAVDSHVPERHRAYALRLLTEVVAEQRWGIGQVATPGWTQHFKGGWGSGTGAVDHQVVLLRHQDGTRVALAVMTTSSPSHAYGNETLREVFSRILAELPS